MRRSSMIRALWALCLWVGCVNCGGGGGENTNDANAQDSAGQNGDSPMVESGAAPIFSFPASAEQPNTVSPDVVVDGGGRHHAAFGDIDGRGFYATCDRECERRSNWQSIQLLVRDISELTGAMTAKIRIGSDGSIHIAYNAKFDSTIFAQHELHYAFCDSICNSPQNWSVGLAYEAPLSHSGRDAQEFDWFALSPANQPRFALVEPEDTLSLDDNLYYLACNENCQDAASWTRQPVLALNFPSLRPATLRFDDNGTPHIILTYNVIGADSAELLYLNCVTDCASSNPQWSEAVSLTTLPDAILERHVVDLGFINGTSPAIVTYRDVGASASSLHLFRCGVDCSTAQSWQQVSISSSLSLPDNMSLVPALEFKVRGSVLELGLIGKKREDSVASTVIKISCSVNCTGETWTYEEAVDTSPIVFDDVGICQFVATGVRPPLSMTASGSGLVLYPHWACGGSPVEVFEPDSGRRYIDYNADVQFFEVAAFAEN